MNKLNLSPKDEELRVRMSAQYAMTYGMEQWCHAELGTPQGLSEDDEIQYLINRIKEIESQPGNAPVLLNAITIPDGDGDDDENEPNEGKEFTILGVVGESEIGWDAGVVFNVLVNETQKILWYPYDYVMTWECFQE